MEPIVVTGIGVISAIGNDAAENRQSLIAGKCGMSHLEMFPSRFAGTLPLGEIKITTDELKQQLTAYGQVVTRTSLLALHAFEQAINDCQLSSAQISSASTALIGANTVGGMCLTDEMYEDAKKESAGSPYLGFYDYASINLFLQKRFNLKGPINTINTACSSSANAIMYGARLIKSGRADRAIVGGVDSLAKFTINGFNALHILSADLCAPFDENRKGLNLGEGAAFLVLEKASAAKNKKNYGQLSGYANANDAYHASSLSEEARGPFKAMQEALGNAGLQPSQIDFINAHGTATENNDHVEGIAMNNLFEEVPDFASTKANIGHTLGAAGAIEAVYCLLNLHYQELYPAINFKQPMALNPLVPNTKYQQKKLQHIMSNSFGFGGNCSTLIFSKV